MKFKGKCWMLLESSLAERDVRVLLTAVCLGSQGHKLFFRVHKTQQKHSKDWLSKEVILPLYFCIDVVSP